MLETLNPRSGCALAPLQTRTPPGLGEAIPNLLQLPLLQPVLLPRKHSPVDVNSLPSAPLLSVSSPSFTRSSSSSTEFYLFTEYLLSTYYVPGTLLRAEDTAATSQTRCLLALLESTF